MKKLKALIKIALKIILVFSIIAFIINKATIDDFVISFFSFNFAILAIIWLIFIKL